MEAGRLLPRVSSARLKTSSGLVSLRCCLPKTVGSPARNPSLPRSRALISQTEMLRLRAKRRLDKSCGLLTSQVVRDYWEARLQGPLEVLVVF